jgi:hypothetical protein
MIRMTLVITTRKPVSAKWFHVVSAALDWDPLVPTRTTGECVNNGATEEAAYNANDGGNRDRARRLAEGNTSDENNSFQALAQHDNERKCEQCPLSHFSASGSV